MKSKFYVLQVIGDVEPVLHGPFDNAETRDACARQLRDEDRSDLNDGLYQLNVDAQGIPAVDGYYCGHLEESDD